MPDYLAPLLGGLAGTVAMTIFLLFPRWFNIGHVDVIRAVGALITGRIDGAFPAGLVVHIGSGIFFAYVYQALLSLAKLPLDYWTGAMAGAVHGVIVMLLVSIAIMEHHPMARYHQRGPMTGLMQLLAHVIYGFVVGLVVQWLGASA